MILHILPYVLLLFAAVSVSVKASAQRRLIVADMVTHTPLRGVNILINNTVEIKSRWDGSFMIDSTATRLTLAHAGYETLATKQHELADTVFLLPDARRIKEVVVNGKMPRPKISFKISETDKMNDMLNAQAQNKGFNILGPLFYLIDKISKKDNLSKKERKRLEHQKMLDNY